MSGAPVTVNGRAVGPAVQAPKMAQIIAARIRGRIVRGELRPGDHLPQENELLAQFGVSRPILRESFRILESEALISVRRGASGGPRILAPDATVSARSVGVLLQMGGSTLADVYEARLIGEPPCAALLAERATPQDLAGLRECLADLEAVLAAAPAGIPDGRAWLEGTNRFHELVLRGSGNPTLAVQGTLLLDIIAMHYTPTLPAKFSALRPSLFQRMLAAFRTLVELVEAHDVDGARKHWTELLEFGKRVLGNDLRNRTLLDLFD